MMRAAWTLLIVGAVAAGVWLVFASSMPAYFTAWLFWIGVPMGALPIVMAMEGAGALESPLLPALRAMLPLLPLGTLFALPMLGDLSFLFARAGLPGALPDWWTAPLALALRDGAILVVLSLLAVLFALTPRRPRRSLATFGLLLTLFVSSLLGVDWLLAPQPALGSSLVGLLLMAGQMALAGAVAGLVLAVGSDPHARLSGYSGLLLALLVAFWSVLQFGQFLVVWSANMPDEAGWYLARIAGAGAPIIAFAALAAAAAIFCLPTALGRIPAALATITATVALALMLVTLLFILPAFRGAFALSVADALAVIGLGGLLIGAMLLLVSAGERRRAMAAP